MADTDMRLVQLTWTETTDHMVEVYVPIYADLERCDLNNAVANLKRNGYLGVERSNMSFTDLHVPFKSSAETLNLAGYEDEGDSLPVLMFALFDPQAWVNNNTVSVATEGENGWEISDSLRDRAAAAHYTNSDLSFLQHDPAAPQWVREWTGPFTISIEVEYQ